MGVHADDTNENSPDAESHVLEEGSDALEEGVAETELDVLDVTEMESDALEDGSATATDSADLTQNRNPNPDVTTNSVSAAAADSDSKFKSRWGDDRH